jgi:hypothetical protein
MNKGAKTIEPKSKRPRTTYPKKVLMNNGAKAKKREILRSKRTRANEQAIKKLLPKGRKMFINKLKSSHYPTTLPKP